MFEEPAPKGTLINGVGAGDSMVAGFVAGWMEKKNYEHAFHMGIAAGRDVYKRQVITCKADTEGTCISWNIHFFCIEVISVDRIHATDRIREFFVDNSVLFTEGNHKFEEFKELSLIHILQHF